MPASNSELLDRIERLHRAEAEMSATHPGWAELQDKIHEIHVVDDLFCQFAQVCEREDVEDKPLWWIQGVPLFYRDFHSSGDVRRIWYERWQAMRSAVKWLMESP